MSRVMVVEDDVILRMSLAMLLTMEGYQVIKAKHGEEALLKLESMGRPCIIILDLMMPVMDGITFRAEQLKRAAFADVPVIIVTGHEDAKNIAAAVSAHALLQKPYKPEQVIDLVKRHCAEGSVGRGCSTGR